MINRFFKVMKVYRFPLGTEAELQDHVESVLKLEKIEYKREFRLDSKNRPDFMIDDYAVELKIGSTRAQAMSIYRQCERYARFDQVKGIVLITNRAMGFPPEINGKPAYCFSLGAAWL